MSNRSQQAKIILGDEYDEALREVLMTVLKTMGGRPQSREWGVGGSQELGTLVVGVGGGSLLVESETYVGLSITGDEALVEEIAAAVAARRGH
jgi:hypothetical protein